MNYIAQINAFQDWAQLNSPSTAQVAMWFALTDINNRCGWKEWFSAPYSMIEVRTGISISGITKTRKALQDNGLIEFVNQGGSKAAIYRMVKLYGSEIVATNVATKVSSSEIVATNGSAEWQQMGHILKQETKTETNNNSVPQSFALYQNEIGIAGSTVTQKLIDDVETYGDDWVCDAIRQAAVNNVKKYSYVEKILQSWATTGRGSSQVAKIGQAAYKKEVSPSRDQFEQMILIQRQMEGMN